MLSDSHRESLIDALAHVYDSVRWSRISTSKNPWDVFNHRVRASASVQTLGEFCTKLCATLGMQQAPIDAVSAFEGLREVESEALDILAREHIQLCMLAVTRRKAWKEAKFGPYVKEEKA